MTKAANFIHRQKGVVFKIQKAAPVFRRVNRINYAVILAGANANPISCFRAAARSMECPKLRVFHMVNAAATQNRISLSDIKNCTFRSS